MKQSEIHATNKQISLPVTQFNTFWIKIKLNMQNSNTTVRQPTKIVLPPQIKNHTFSLRHYTEHLTNYLILQITNKFLV